jgi:hypothetical protein
MRGLLESGLECSPAAAAADEDDGGSKTDDDEGQRRAEDWLALAAGPKPGARSPPKPSEEIGDV